MLALMPEKIATFTVHNLPYFKRQLRQWADAQAVVLCLDSNEYPGDRYGRWELLAGIGCADICQKNAGTGAFDALKDFSARHRGRWLFGGFGFDLKNEVEALTSRHPNRIGLPDLFFFQPEITIAIPRRTGESPWTATIYAPGDPAAIFAAIESVVPNDPGADPDALPDLTPRFSKAEYCQTVETIRAHIAGGDLYEMNFCQEFYAENARIRPLAVYERLNQIGRAPFSAYFHHADAYLLCASPERFLAKKNGQLVSQPIKGTRRRSADPDEDARICAELAASEKDRAENVMIVDLVRNDFARHCRPGSIDVTELCRIYTFATVHQMISTVTGELPPEANPWDALRDAFPMGSMTGAPKVMALELTERYERSRRGLFSGAVGYIDPVGDFDFNVVIRSILYHAATEYLSCQVGGAIVYDSVPELEYEECLVKLATMRRALKGS